jgi:hypothetical protein
MFLSTASRHSLPYIASYQLCHPSIVIHVVHETGYQAHFNALDFGELAEEAFTQLNVSENII